MKTKVIIVATAGLLSLGAQAIPITGEISFSGAYTVNNPNLALATAFTSFSGVTVADTSGDYGVFANGTASTWTPFVFDPFAGAPSLWSIASGPGASFNLEALTIDFESPFVLLLSGTGTAFLGGMDPTPGTWNLTANTRGTTFAFSSSSAATNVADGGSTVIMLGLALLGLPIVRRILAK